MIRRCSGAVAAGHLGALVRLHGQVRLLRQHGRAGLRRPRQLLLAAQSILHVLHTCTRLHYDAALCVCCKFHIAVGQHRIGREPLMCSGVLDRSRSAQNRSRALDVFRCSGVLFGTGLRVAGVLACYDACACVRGRRVQQFSPRITTCLLSTITWLLLSQASRRRAVVVHDRQAGSLVFPGPLQGIRPRSGAPPENGGRPSGAHVAQCLVFDAHCRYLYAHAASNILSHACAWAGHAWDWVAATWD